MPDEPVTATDSDGSSDTGDEAGLRAFATLGDVLTEDGWYPVPSDTGHVYQLKFEGENGELTCFAKVEVEREQFLFYVSTPLRIPEPMRPAAAEYIARANYGLRIGNFEMDFSDGEVRYKSSVGFRGGNLDPYLIRNVVYPAVRTTDIYLPGLLAVAFGGQPADEAIAEVEP